MNYEEEIKRLRRLNMKIYMTMANIISILNDRETDTLLLKNLENIKKEIVINEDDYDDNFELFNKIFEDITKLKGSYLFLKGETREIKKKLDYLMKRQLEREQRLSKFFTYDSSDNNEECNNSNNNEKCDNSDCSECEKDKFY